MEGSSRWVAWHEPYADDDSPLSRRLALIQQVISRWLDERADEPLRVVSICAGQGHDLLGVLSERADAGRVRATLLEADEHNAAVARARVRAAGLSQVSVCVCDAGQMASYLGLVPADLVLMAGVFGNISDADVRRTILALPHLCAPHATVIWTRSRRPPDLTPTIREWFAGAGFKEISFDAPDDVMFTVGVHRAVVTPRTPCPKGELFRFLEDADRGGGQRQRLGPGGNAG